MQQTMLRITVRCMLVRRIDCSGRREYRPRPESSLSAALTRLVLCVQDPEATLRFYTEVLGMSLMLKLDFPDSKFSLYFLGYCNEEDIPEVEAERVSFLRASCIVARRQPANGSAVEPNS